MKTTLTADKVRLRLAVAPIGKTAYRASLAGMPGVNGYNLNTKCFSFILQEPLELGETPRMKPSFSFTPSCLDLSADIGEVFNYDSRASRNAFQDRSRENVVAIPSEALFTPSEVSKVSFGTLRAVGLQSLSQSESPFDDFLPVAVSVKAVIRTNGRSGNTEVYTDSLPIRNKGYIGQFDNDMQVKPSLTMYQVGGGSRRADSIVGVFRKGKEDMLPADSGGKINRVRFPVHFEGMKVVAWRAINRLGATNLITLLRLSYSGLNSLRSLLSSLNMQVRDKGGISCFAVSVSQTVKCIGIPVSLFPTYLTDKIKRGCELANRILQCFCLFRSSVKSDSYRSIHTDIIPYTNDNSQIQGKEVGQGDCQLKLAVPLP